MYPLGSCTMKYNPRVNEFVARLEGIATEHPYQPQELSQGCLRILRLLEQCLLEITGMDAITLQPAAGAQGELTGLLLIRAYLQKQGNPRKRVLIPDSAHGTNPATAVIAGYEVANIKSGAQGQVDIEGLRKMVNEDVAALMITNPSRAKSAQFPAGFAREGRVAVHGRREHECACGHNPPGRSRRGRHALDRKSVV